MYTVELYTIKIDLLQTYISFVKVNVAYFRDVTLNKVASLNKCTCTHQRGPVVFCGLARGVYGASGGRASALGVKLASAYVGFTSYPRLCKVDMLFFLESWWFKLDY